MEKSLLVIIVSLFLAVFLVSQVYGWETVYVVKSNHEATEIIPLTPSSSVVGNVSANGLIDFYVSSPSGSIVYCSNQVTFSPFSFTASENGNYTLHIANNNQTDSVTATLRYSKNLVVVLSSEIRVNSAVGTTVIPATATSIDWVTLIVSSPIAVWALKNLRKIGRGLKKLVTWFRWWKRYRKPQDPIPYVTIRS